MGDAKKTQNKMQKRLRMKSSEPRKGGAVTQGILF